MEAFGFQVSPYAAAANSSIMAQDGKYAFWPQPSPPVSLPSSPHIPDAADAALLGGATEPAGPPTTATAASSSSPPSQLAPPTPLPPPLPLPEVLGTIHVRVSVKDSGPGVSVENSQHLFQMYGQVSAGKTQKGSGTGLGLSISKSIIELRQCCRMANNEQSSAELIKAQPARRPLGTTICSTLA